MSQISPPIRILLVCAVAFLAAWMLFLRPSSEAGAPATETPVTTPVEAGGEQADSLAGKAVEKANEATAAQDARAEELAGGVGETAAEGGTVAPAAAPAATATKTGAPTEVSLPSKEQLAKVPAEVRKAFVKRQIVVLGVVAPKGTDDRRVRKSLGKVDKLHGRVFVKTVPVKRISRYGTIMRGADLSQTPSVVVVDFGFKATTLAGWVDAPTIDQAVVDAIRASGELYPDPYLRQVAEACSHAFPAMARTEATSSKEYSSAIGRLGTLATGFKRDMAGLSTPKKWRPFSKAVQADVASYAATLATWHGELGAKPTLERALAAEKRHKPVVERKGKSLNERFDKHDVLGCGSKS